MEGANQNLMSGVNAFDEYVQVLSSQPRMKMPTSAHQRNPRAYARGSKGVKSSSAVAAEVDWQVRA